MDYQQFRLSVVKYCPTTKTHYGKWSGEKGNRALREPLPLDPLPERFGVYPILPGGNKTQIGVLDFDNHNDPGLEWEELVNIARPIVSHLRSLGHFPIPFRSTGGRGIHVWLFWDAPQVAKSVRSLLINTIDAFGFDSGDKGVDKGQIEVFPKQDEVPSDSVGSCIDPPLAGKSCPLHPETLDILKEPVVLTTSYPLSPTLVVPPVKKQSFSWNEETVKSALDTIPADDYEDWISVLRSLLGGSIRAGVDARKIAEDWSKKSSKHSGRDFDKKWDRGFPKERSGNGRSLGTLYWIAEKKYGWRPPAPPCSVSRIRVQDSEPKLYLVTIVGHEEKEVPMRSSDLNSKTAFLNRVLEVIDQIVSFPKKDDLNRLLSEAERVEVDDDATTLGQFRNHLVTYLDEAIHPDKEELRLSHRAWRDNESNRSWFKWRDLESWLRRQRHYDLKHTEAFHMIRLLKGGKGRVDLGKYGKQSAWWVPIDPRERTPEPDAMKIPKEAGTPF